MDEVEVIETPNYELIEYEGEECRFYPASGAVMTVGENGATKIVANLGGRPDMSTEVARGMAERRAQLRNEAIAQGLISAGLDMKLPHAGTPYAVLAEIVRQRALVATRDNRDGNEAAKFIFSITKMDAEEEKAENSIKFTLSEQQMSDVMGKIFKEEE